MTIQQRALFLCTGNSARSQMAEGWLRSLGSNRFNVFSAGTHPTVVNPNAIEAMKEVGIDLSGHRSKYVEEFKGQEFDYVITVCDRANESCPIWLGQTMRLHWSFEDPAAVTGPAHEVLEAFRRSRDLIGERIKKFLGSGG